MCNVFEPLQNRQEFKIENIVFLVRSFFLQERDKHCTALTNVASPSKTAILSSHKKLGKIRTKQRTHAPEMEHEKGEYVLFLKACQQ